MNRSETLAALGKAYGEHLRGLRRAPATISNFNAHSGDFIRFCEREFGLSLARDLQRAHLLAYVQDLRGRELSPLTRYTRQRLVRTWLHWATLRGYLLLDPSRDLHWRHPPHLPRGAPTEGQMQALLATAAAGETCLAQRDLALFEFLYGTGLRSAECLAVDLDHLDLVGRQVRVVCGKGGRSRVVPLGPRLAKLLQTYVDQVRPQFSPRDTAALWLNQSGTRLAPVTLDGTLRGYVRALGFTNFTVHGFRHAFATHLLSRGAPLVAVQRLLGHASLQSTSHYTHLVPLAVREELLRTHPRGRRRTSPKRRK